MDVRGTEIAPASLFAVPIAVLLVLGDRTNENGVAMQRKSFFAATIEMHRAATGPAADVGNGRRISDLRLTALALQDRCVARDRRYHHDAHATDLQTTAQEMCMETARDVQQKVPCRLARASGHRRFSKQS